MLTSGRDTGISARGQPNYEPHKANKKE